MLGQWQLSISAERTKVRLTHRCVIGNEQLSKKIIDLVCHFGKTQYCGSHLCAHHSMIKIIGRGLVFSGSGFVVMHSIACFSNYLPSAV